MKPEIHNLEREIAGASWISSTDLGAGIYFLDGRTHVAGHSSPAERVLLDRGALLVGSIRFDRELDEAYRDAHRVRLMEPDEAVRVLAAPLRRS